MKRWIPPLAAVAAAAVVFLPVLSYGFLEYDDLIYVFENPLSAGFSIASVVDVFFSPYYRSYSPLTLLSHAVDLSVWGQHGGMHHLVNLLLHVLNVLLVYRVAREVSLARTQTHGGPALILAPLSAALMFAVHPLQVEPVAWISGRKDVLMTFFLLVSFLFYLRWSRDSGEQKGEGGGGRASRWFSASTIAFVLAVLSKSTAAVFPLVLIVTDRLVLGRCDGWRTLVREKAVMVAVGVAAVAAAVLSGRGYDTSDLVSGTPPLVRVALPLFTPAYYLWQLCWPFGLTPFTPLPALPWVFSGAGVTAGVTALLIRLRRPLPVAAWLAFLLLLVPTVGGTFMETGMQPWADRFTYAPMIPVFLALGSGIAMIPWRSARYATVVVLTFGLGLASRSQLGHWESTEAIWSRVVHASPSLAKGHKNLGAIRLAQGNNEEAVRLLRRAVDLKPGYAEAHADLGIALVAAGRPEEALPEYRTAIELDSTRIEGYNGYGIALLQTGNPLGAYGVFRRGIEVHPASARLRYNAGMAALASGDTVEAIARLQEAAALEPTEVRVIESVAVLMETKGDAAAAEWYERAAEAGSEGARRWVAERDRIRRERGQ